MLKRTEVIVLKNYTDPKLHKEFQPQFLPFGEPMVPAEHEMQKQLIELNLKYLQELGHLESHKFVLEFELSMMNRNLERLSEVLSFGDELDVNRIFQSTCDEFYDNQRKVEELKNGIQNIEMLKSSATFDREGGQIMEELDRVIRTLHPDYRKYLDRWSQMGLTPLTGLDLKEGADRLVDGDGSLKHPNLSDYLPRAMLDLTSNETLLGERKAELNQTIEDLTTLKDELEQLFLALIPYDSDHLN